MKSLLISGLLCICFRALIADGCRLLCFLTFSWPTSFKDCSSANASFIKCVCRAQMCLLLLIYNLFPRIIGIKVWTNVNLETHRVWYVEKCSLEVNQHQWQRPCRFFRQLMGSLEFIAFATVSVKFLFNQVQLMQIELNQTETIVTANCH